MDSKRLTADNFLLPDPLTGESPGQDGDGCVHRLSAMDWAHEILSIELGESVPEAVRNRFELARGVFLYGYFWYPLWVQGTMEALNAAELALEAACAAEGGPKQLATAESRIEWLAKRRVLGAADAGRWQSLLDVRNALADAGETTILTPRTSLYVLDRVCSAVKALFRIGEAEGAEA